MIDAPKSPANRTHWFYLAGLFLVILGAKLALIGDYGSSTPFWDQWDGEAAAILIPSQEGTLKPASLLAPHCEHRIFFSRVLSIGLLKLNRIWDPKVEMVANAFIHAASLVILIGLCGRLLSSYAAKVLVGGFITLIFVLPFGWENTLWGFQSQFYFVILWGIIGIACCWSHATLSKGWWLGILFFSLGFISMAGGVFAPAVTCGLMAVRFIEDRDSRLRQGIGLLILVALTTTGLLLVQHVDGHDVLKATGIAHFVKTLLKITSWPSQTTWMGFILQAPLLLLLGWTLWRRQKTSDPAWLLITLGMWCAGQAVAIAYGRATGALASRYTDNFALGLCINFACLLYWALTLNPRFRKTAVFLTAGWFGLVTSLLIYSAFLRLPEPIYDRRDESRHQEINVRGFLTSGDILHLKDKPHMHVPYPNAERLARILEEPTLRALLPTNLRAPLAPSSATGDSDGAFSLNAYGLGITPLPFDQAWSSYADAELHVPRRIELHFPAERRTSWVKISVVGYATPKDLSLSVIDAQGKTRQLTLPPSAPRWRSVFFPAPDGAFVLQAVDASPGSWFAFTLPREIGPLTLVGGLLHGNALLIIVLGGALTGAGVWLDPRARAFARYHRIY